MEREREGGGGGGGGGRVGCQKAELGGGGGGGRVGCQKAELLCLVLWWDYQRFCQWHQPILITHYLQYVTADSNSTQSATRVQ